MVGNELVEAICARDHQGTSIRFTTLRAMSCNASSIAVASSDCPISGAISAWEVIGNRIRTKAEFLAAPGTCPRAKIFPSHFDHQRYLKFSRIIVAGFAEHILAKAHNLPGQFCIRLKPLGQSIRRTLRDFMF